jgi:hypothetical protein
VDAMGGNIMRFKITGILFIFFITLTLGCTQTIWLPKSDAKRQNLEKIVSKKVTELAERDNYFPPSLIMKYVDGVMNSLNKNNGHALIIAHDGQRFTKLTFILDNNENIRLNTTTYSKDFFAMFKEYEIDQSDWPKLIYQFNTLGYATAAGDGKIKYSYDFEKGTFLINRKRTVPSNNYLTVPVSLH